MTTARQRPQITPTRTSFQITFSISDGSISPTDIPRMIMVLDWLPEFPPVLMSMGINVTSSGTAANAASYSARMLPVIVLLSMRINSHKIRFFASCSTLVFK